MKKKIIFNFNIHNFLISCGKKDDPEYKGSLDRTIIQNKIIKTS